MLSSPLMLQMPSSMTDDQFFEFCQLNRDLRIERNQFGDISIMSPAGSETGNREGRIIQQLMNWTDEDGTGIAFSSSTGFTLSTGAKRSPDASWIKLSRWNKLTSAQQEKFAPICPDFVIELRSSSDNLQPLKEKMQEYMQEPEIQLGLLIDRKNRRVYIYRPGQIEECLENPDTVNCDPVLPGFVLNMGKIW
ncbi:Uma2 family endonuclease [Dolichospermum sp. ST_sed1]|nr:Uma2 family endonuclease [Dolichospermum sp. ST_sed1]MDD1423020.1 Uma2 family endonuclease [Dolichospermum sp. ST_sed9]MDD1430105.1 Uma2 family endonuclease [Dolichospermum sp. ST_sed6]MDD1436128.1 Uma2 family endonuclease [Dolichospermum sp. ST_sed10]MDD1439128.1 Uma2 family endonuclease [Dolichospermum sp. ST_sed3]MDD1444912.1 Uma2 family endonuclease [Dolichospermum sp. ST_sed8]MDD1453481.1 Uma2 family endonuclease [Dolichospermum sp. ST_sed7]MDD1458660.1 Uma2 family endonuclease [Doli